MSRILLIGAICAVLSAPSLLAQNLILNGSFEDTTAVGCAFNNSNAEFNAAMANATAFGTSNEICIMEGMCTYGLAPQDGQFKVGIASTAPIGTNVDAFAFDLLAPLVAGGSYTLTFQAHAVVTSFSPDIDSVEIGLSNDPTSFGTAIYAAMPGSAGWTQLGLTFTAPINATHLTVRQGANFDAWNHIDNFSLVEGSPPECYMFLGMLEGSMPLGPEVDDVLLVMPVVAYPATTTQVPNLFVPNQPALLNLTVAAQIGMYNPIEFPNNPLQMSNGLRVIIGVGTQTFGQNSGIVLSGVGTPELGQNYDFAFTIQ